MQKLLVDWEHEAPPTVPGLARAWLESHKSERPRVITYDVHCCCGGGKIYKCSNRGDHGLHADGDGVKFCSDWPGWTGCGLRWKSAGAI